MARETSVRVEVCRRRRGVLVIIEEEGIVVLLGIFGLEIRISGRPWVDRVQGICH